MFLRIFIFLFTLLPCLLYGQFRAIDGAKDEAVFDSTTVIIRLKDPALESMVKRKALTGKISKPFNSTFDKLRVTNSHSSISEIIKIEFDNPDQARVFKESISLQPGIMYAEYLPQSRFLLIPNDPLANPISGEQDHLNIINAYQAWNLETGDPKIIVGILDTGADFDHSDLQGNHFKNLGDPVNGIDDDNDGFIDNFNGWDFGNSDNDPSSDGESHGPEVAGFSSATTNNQIGIAGTGYNCSYVPLKISVSGSTMVTNGFEAIVYAADLGYDVINLSWGRSTGGASKFEQDIINYAVLEKDVVVIAAAGNTDGELNFYPASYDNVLSVGASDMHDNKAIWATYSYNIDILAPGDQVFSTTVGNTYMRDKGTSYASPQVAGAAALVRSRFPNLNAIQVMEKIRVSADDIYNVGSNQNYFGKLGKGRLNMLRALTDVSPAIRIHNFSYYNGTGQYAFYGDTVALTMDFTNYLDNASNVSIKISTESPYVSILNEELVMGEINTLETKNNHSSPLRILLSSDTPPEEEIIFRIDIEDVIYRDFQYLKINTSPDFLNLENELVGLTINSSGNLGYHLDGYSEGIGFRFKGKKILVHLGLVISESETRISSSSVNDFENNIRDHDFSTVDNIKYYRNSVADIETRSSFKEISGHTDPLNILVEQKIMAWNGIASFVMEYRITNTGTTDLNNLKLGLFADWHLNDYSENKTAWLNSDSLAYVHNLTNTKFAGISLLSKNEPIYKALNIGSFNGNSSDVNTPFTKIQKHQFMSSGIDGTEAGINGNGNDVAHLVGGAISSLAVNESKKVVMAMVAGESLSELTQALTDIKLNYQNYLLNPPLVHTFFACPEEGALIDPPGEVYEFYSDLQVENLIHTGESYLTGVISEPEAYYLINKDLAYDSDVIKVLAEPAEINADFSFSPELLLLDEDMNYSVQFTSTSVEANQWQWDFNNGFASTQENPTIEFTQEGDYQIQLEISNQAGCIDSITNTLVVRVKSPKPDISPIEICGNESAMIAASNSNHILVYTDSLLTDLLFEGDAYQTDSLSENISYFITSNVNGYESLPVKVPVSVHNPIAGIELEIDTTSLNLLTVKSYIENFGYNWFVDQQSVSDKESFPLQIPTSPFEIELIVKDEIGCEESTTRIVTPKVSPEPVFSDIDFCKNSNIRIQPSNGTLFAFYNNIDLSELIHIGKELVISELNNSRVIFITGLDSLLISEPIKINLNLDSIKADFSLPQDSIGLNYGSIKLNDLSVNAVEWRWDFGNGTFSTQQNPEVEFSDLGVFDIRLEAASVNGCVDQISKSIFVDFTTALSESFDNLIKIYPNPSEGIMSIEIETGVDFIGIHNSTGKPMKLIANPGMKLKIDLRNFPSGVYFLNFHSGTRVVSRKILLEK